MQKPLTSGPRAEQPLDFGEKRSPASHTQGKTQEVAGERFQEKKYDFTKSYFYTVPVGIWHYLLDIIHKIWEWVFPPREADTENILKDMLPRSPQTPPQKYDPLKFLESKGYKGLVEAIKRRDYSLMLVFIQSTLEGNKDLPKEVVSFLEKLAAKLIQLQDSAPSQPAISPIRFGIDQIVEKLKPHGFDYQQYLQEAFQYKNFSTIKVLIESATTGVEGQADVTKLLFDLLELINKAEVQLGQITRTSGCLINTTGSKCYSNSVIQMLAHSRLAGEIQHIAERSMEELPEFLAARQRAIREQFQKNGDDVQSAKDQSMRDIGEALGDLCRGDQKRAKIEQKLGLVKILANIINQINQEKRQPEVSPESNRQLLQNQQTLDRFVALLNQDYANGQQDATEFFEWILIEILRPLGADLSCTLPSVRSFGLEREGQETGSQGELQELAAWNPIDIRQDYDSTLGRTEYIHEKDVYRKDQDQGMEQSQAAPIREYDLEKYIKETYAGKVRRVASSEDASARTPIQFQKDFVSEDIAQKQKEAWIKIPRYVFDSASRQKRLLPQAAFDVTKAFTLLVFAKDGKTPVGNLTYTPVSWVLHSLSSVEAGHYKQVVSERGQLVCYNDSQSQRGQDGITPQYLKRHVTLVRYETTYAPCQASS